MFSNAIAKSTHIFPIISIVSGYIVGILNIRVSGETNIPRGHVPQRVLRNSVQVKEIPNSYA